METVFAFIVLILICGLVYRFIMVLPALFTPVPAGSPTPFPTVIFELIAIAVVLWLLITYGHLGAIGHVFGN